MGVFMAGKSLRTLLLQAAAVGAVAAIANLPGKAFAEDCPTATGGVADCTGDHHGGISYNDATDHLGVTTINVHNLTAPITPPSILHFGLPDLRGLETRPAYAAEAAE